MDEFETRNPFDGEVTLEDLIKRKPFKQATDKRGHFITISARVPDWFARRIKVMAESRKTPYEIKSDAIRDALYLGLRILSKRYDSPDFETEAAMVDAVDQAKELGRIRNETEQLAQSLEEYWQDNDKGVAAQHLTKYVSAAVSHGDDWRRNKTLKNLAKYPVVQRLLLLCEPEIQQALSLEE